MNAQQHQQLPSLLAIAEHFRALADPQSDENEDDALVFKIAADQTQDHAVAALMLIADLIAEYPTGTGNEEQLLRQAGSAVRVLAEVLELAGRTRELASEVGDGFDRGESMALNAIAA
jgi:hypothetical protein